MKSDSELKRIPLHLGCGKRFIPAFVHIDVDKHPYLDYQHGFTKLPMFGDDSVDLIYNCGVLDWGNSEHRRLPVIVRSCL